MGIFRFNAFSHKVRALNLADHNNIQDMKVSVIKQVNGGTAPRQREERRLIFKLKTLAPSGMNIEFKLLMKGLSRNVTN